MINFGIMYSFQNKCGKCISCRKKTNCTKRVKWLKNYINFNTKWKKPCVHPEMKSGEKSWSENSFNIIFVYRLEIYLYFVFFQLGDILNAQHITCTCTLCISFIWYQIHYLRIFLPAQKIFITKITVHCKSFLHVPRVKLQGWF